MPTWSRTHPELFYSTTDQQPQIMVAPYIVEGDSFRAERPRLLNERRLVQTLGGGAETGALTFIPTANGWCWRRSRRTARTTAAIRLTSR